MSLFKQFQQFLLSHEDRIEIFTGTAKSFSLTLLGLLTAYLFAVMAAVTVADAKTTIENQRQLNPMKTVYTGILPKKEMT